MKIETTIQGTLHGLSPAGLMALEKTARLFQSARRTAFQALATGRSRSQIEAHLRQRFDLDARFARDAILEAQAVHSALRELVPRYLADVQKKMVKTERYLAHYRSGQWTPKNRPLEEVIAQLQKRLDKLQRKRDCWQSHIQAHTTPPVIFGTASAFYARRRGRLSHREWRLLRQRQFWSRGEKHKGGNPHIKIVPAGEELTIHIAVLPQQKGHLRYVTAKLWVDPSQHSLLRQGLQDAYSVRVLNKDGQWHVQLTLREQVVGNYLAQAPAGCRVGGLDCNTDRMCGSVVSPEGNLLAHRTFWLRDVPDMRSAQATWHISQVLDAVLRWLQEQQAHVVVLERLKFAQTHDTHKQFNRATTRFRSTMVKMAARKALRSGLHVVEVDPAYTSVIGKHKYSAQYGLSSHEAAALVIARRGQNRGETLPKSIIAQLLPLRNALSIAAKRDADPQRRRRFGLWVRLLANWKQLHSWSLWSIWEEAHHLI